MPTPAEVWQRRQRQVSAATADAVVRAWAKIERTTPQRGFEMVLPELVGAVTAGQIVAADGADAYLTAALAVEGVTPAPAARVAPTRLAGIASDGRSLVGLLTQPLIRTLYLRTQGADDATALAGGRLSLETLVRTEVYDTGRDAVSLAMGLEPQVVGYERYVNSPACSRCVLLAGRFYSKSSGFLRHPRCDCAHRPVTSTSKRDGTEQEPRGLFNAMTPAQQDKSFGRDNAEIVRRGGDIGQVVNARRGMATAGSNWTTANASKRQRRPSPGFLLQQAGDDPDKFAKALKRAGYL